MPRDSTYPCYSARVLRPCLGLSGSRLSLTLEEQLSGLEPEQRLTATYVHALLDGAARQDAAVGLHAAERLAVGDLGLLDFLMTSAPTPREALAIAHSHIRLVSDVHQLSLRVDGAEARVCLEARVDTPRALDQLLLAWLLRSHVTRWHCDRHQAELWFPHAAPRELGPYEALRARVHFGAAQAAIGFPSWLLDVPLRHRNRRLHAVLRRAADEELTRLPAGESISERVRRAVSAQLQEGSVSVAKVAHALALHPRTLSRALLREGTTFQALVGRARKDAALHWLGQDDLPLAEVARRAGFQSKAPFHRSFRRWTGETPSSYRRKQHGDLALALPYLR